MCFLQSKKQLPNDASFGNSPKAPLSTTQISACKPMLIIKFTNTIKEGASTQARKHPVRANPLALFARRACSFTPAQKYSSSTQMR
jgi:hypothetical protein